MGTLENRTVGRWPKSFNPEPEAIRRVLPSSCRSRDLHSTIEIVCAILLGLYKASSQPNPGQSDLARAEPWIMHIILTQEMWGLDDAHASQPQTRL